MSRVTEEPWWSGEPSLLSLLEIAAAAGLPASTAQHCGKQVSLNLLHSKMFVLRHTDQLSRLNSWPSSSLSSFSSSVVR